ncbi:MAG: phage portal protein [Caulobacter sp.]|nr:phage portal protein [Caulobacter sp.]
MASGFDPGARDATDDRWFGGDGAGAMGGPVTADTVIMAGAVFPIVSGIAETIGTLPLEIIRRDGSAGEDYPYAESLCDGPNPLMTSDEFWSTFAFNTVLRGRAYAEPIIHSSTELELWPLSPVRLVEDHGERTFGVDYFYEDGRSRRFRQGELLTGSGISTDGVYSVVPWKTARLAIDMANTLEAFGRAFFKNGARPSGVLSTEQTLTEPALERLKNQFNGNFAGVLNAGKVPILEASLKYLPITNNNVDNQYLELRRNAVREVARNWRYPLHMLGESESDEDTEQRALEFVKYVIRPWTGRIEKAIGRDLMTPAQRRVYRAKFDLDGLLRGDSATQWRNAVLARTASLASANELRVGWFDLPRIEEDWADDPRTPLNSNRAADTTSGGMTSPQDRTDA